MNDKEQILNLITGNIDEDKKGELLKKVKSDPELKKEYDAMKNAWALSSRKSDVTELNIERSYLALKSKMSKQNVTISRRIYWVFKYAAIVILVFGFGLYADSFLDFFTTGKIASNNQTEIVVPAGQVAEVNLPDGSHVWLNAGTSFSFPKNFSTHNRHIDLKGEAFFEVKKGKERFVVSTSSGDITVLGTKFNVSAFDESEFQTTLVEGVIKFRSNFSNKEFIIQPGQQIISTNGNNVLVQNVETNKYTSWRNGIIVFDKEPLRSVIRKLERRFAITIEMNDKDLADIRFTGSIENETLPEVLGYISKTKPIQFTYTKNKKTVIISPN